MQNAPLRTEKMKSNSKVLLGFLILTLTQKFESVENLLDPICPGFWCFGFGGHFCCDVHIRDDGRDVPTPPPPKPDPIDPNPKNPQSVVVTTNVSTNITIMVSVTVFVLAVLSLLVVTACVLCKRNRQQGPPTATAVVPTERHIQINEVNPGSSYVSPSAPQAPFNDNYSIGMSVETNFNSVQASFSSK